MTDFSTTGRHYLFNFYTKTKNKLFDYDSSTYTDDSVARYFHFCLTQKTPFDLWNQNDDQTTLIISTPDTTEQPKYATIQHTMNNTDFTPTTNIVYTGHEFTVQLQNPYIETDITGGVGSFSIIGGDHIIKVSKTKE